MEHMINIKRFEKKGEGYFIYICESDGNEKIFIFSKIKKYRVKN